MTMKNVTEDQFNKFLQNASTHTEPTVDTDQVYRVETWTDFDDNEVAIETFHKGEAVSWMVAA